MILPALLACSAAPDPAKGDPTYPDQPTETFPQFLGSVPRNLLMISMDTFRKDHVGRYGEHGVTDFLDARMAEGVVLDRHLSCSNWTMPSAWCVTTGASNVDAGYVPVLSDGADAIAPPIPTLAGRLADAGYETVLLTSNGWFGPDHGLTEGFDVALRPEDSDERHTLPLLELGQTYAAGGGLGYLHVHVKEPHSPYDPPEQYLDGLEGLGAVPYDLSTDDGLDAARDDWEDLPEDQRALVLQHLLVRYEGEVAWLDDQLEEGWRGLDAAGLLDDTLVVFWVDHGEQFWDHDEQGHAFDLHAEENEVIAFFWAKNIVPGVWDGPTWHPDLAPTVLDLFGFDAPDTMSGLPLGTADPARVLLPLVAARNGVVQAAVRGDEKLHYWWSGEKEWYDLAADPTEQVDAYDPESASVIDLWAALLPEVERVQALLPERSPDTPGP